MRQFANQIQYLSLYQEQLGARSVDALGLLPNLKAMKVGALKFENAEGYMDVCYFNPFVVLKLLRLAPNLQECIFDRDVKIDVLIDDSEDDEEEDGELVSNLHTLKLGSPRSDGRLCQCDIRMLPYLTLPSLQTLHLTFSVTSPAALSSFLRRSSPPLHTLILAYDSQWADVTDCLRLVPSLECLKLYVKLTYHDPSLLDIPPSTLSDSALQLVPNLGTLEIDSECEYIAERCYAAFLRVLFSRRSKLVRASLTLDKRDDPEPDPAVYAGLQELAAEGMDIHLRSWDRQWFPLSS